MRDDRLTIRQQNKQNKQHNKQSMDRAQAGVYPSAPGGRQWVPSGRYKPNRRNVAATLASAACSRSALRCLARVQVVKIPARAQTLQHVRDALFHAPQRQCHESKRRILLTLSKLDQCNLRARICSQIYHTLTTFVWLFDHTSDCSVIPWRTLIYDTKTSI